MASRDTSVSELKNELGTRPATLTTMMEPENSPVHALS